MPSFDKTWVGHAVAPANEDGEDRTLVERPEDRTSVDRFRTERTESSSLTTDMVEELRRRLREAEALEEGSGVRLRPTPTPEEGLDRPAILPSSPGEEVAPTVEAAEAADPLADLEIEVEAPRGPSDLDEVMSALPELEVALAPNSESNFYAGFDDEHPDGVFVATYRRLSVDTPVYVDVHLPAGYRFRTPAIVAWVREPEAADEGAPAGIGLEMCGLDHRMRRLIRNFVRHRKPIFYIG